MCVSFHFAVFVVFRFVLCFLLVAFFLLLLLLLFLFSVRRFLFAASFGQIFIFRWQRRPRPRIWTSGLQGLTGVRDSGLAAAVQCGTSEERERGTKRERDKYRGRVSKRGRWFATLGLQRSLRALSRGSQKCMHTYACVCVNVCVFLRERVSGCKCVWTSDDDDDDDYELQPAYYVQRPQRLAERTLPLKHWQLQVEVRTHTHTGTRIHRHIRTLVHLTKTESTAASNASAQLRRQRERQRQRQRQRRRRRWSQNFPGQHYFRIVQIHLDEHQLAIGLDVRRPSQSQAKPTKPTKPTNSTKPAKPSDLTTQQPIDQPAKKPNNQPTYHKNLLQQLSKPGQYWRHLDLELLQGFSQLSDNVKFQSVSVWYNPLAKLNTGYKSAARTLFSL